MNKDAALLVHNHSTVS